MAKFNKAGCAVGILLLLLAAFFCIALILQPLDFGAYGPGRNNILYSLGRMLVSVYGLCSILIPAFLFTAAVVSIAGAWSTRKAVRLLTAAVPFFTAVITENICRSIVALGGSFTGIKIGITLTLGAMLLIIEYLGAGIIADRTGGKTRTERVLRPEKPEADDDELPLDVQEVYEEDILSAPSGTGTGTMQEQAEPADSAEDDPFANLFDYTYAHEQKPEPEQNDTGVQQDAAEVQPGDPDDPVNPDSGETDETESDSAKSAAAITEAEYHALTAAPDTGTQDSTDIEELEWPDMPIQSDGQDNAFTGTDDDTPFPDEAQETVAAAGEPDDTSPDGSDAEPENGAAAGAAAEGSDRAATDATEAETLPADTVPEKESTGALDPDFFDIDMNAETEEEEEEEEAQEHAVALSHIAPETLTVIASNIVPLKTRTDAAETGSIAVAKDVFAEMDEDVRRNLPVPPETPVRNGTVPDGKHTPVLDGQAAAQESTVQAEPLPSAQDSDAGTGVSVPEARTVTPDVLTAAPPVKSAPEKKIVKMKGPYKIPIDLLTAYEDDQYWIIDEETKNASVQLKETLNEFNIEADVTGIKKGPVVTMFEILPAPGVKLSKIVALQDNIALRLAASSVRIVAPIPGKRAVGIEIPNKERSIVSFREMIEQDLPEFKKMAVPVILGKDILGKPQLLDLVKTPHLLIAGSTGSGKSVCVNSIILSVLYKRSPQEVKLILIDPKIVELKLYNDIPHLLVPVITESKKAFQALQWSLCEMERRYALLDSMGSRDISNYNRKIEEKHIATEKIPYIVIIIDEFADLMATTGKELESTVARLAAMSRAVGIHLVLATQRPSIDVITGLIKANIPTRIAFMVASKMDSRIIIDQVGAEKLLGKGDMLYSSAVDPFPVRIQGTFVSDQEVENVVDYVKKFGEPDYIDDEVFVADDDDDMVEPSLFGEGEDPLYNQALDIVVQAGKASASYIQRRLKIGYNRAARLVEEMEDRGLVGPANGSKPREIIHIP